jgi:ABC-2 type transport system permease protein
VSARANAPLRDLALLLRLRVRLLLRGEAGKRTGSQSRGRSLALRAVAIGAFAVFVSLSLADLLRNVVSGPVGRALLLPLLSWASSWGTIFLFLLSVPLVLGALTYNSDLRLLLLTPVSPRLIMAEKLVALAGGSSAILIVIGGIILVAVGEGLRLGAAFYVAGAFTLVLLPIAPVTLALILVIGVLRWVPPARARNIAAIIGAGLGITYYLAIQRINTGAARTGDIRAMLTRQQHAWWRSLPTSWPGQGLAAIAEGDYARGLAYLGGMTALTLLLASVAIVVSAHLFATGWATYQEVGRRGRTEARPAGASALPQVAAAGSEADPRVAGSGHARPQESSRPGVWTSRLPWLALVDKEWRTLRRDPQIWAGLIYPLFIVGFGFYRTVSSASRAAPAEFSLFTIGWFYGTLGFMVYLMAAVLALPVVNREGKALYLLALSPLAPRDVVVAKWIFCAAPIALLAEGVVLLSAVLLDVTPPEVLIAALIYPVLVVALVGALLLVSLIWPKIDWDNPRRPTSATASIVGSLAGLAISGATTALLIFTFWEIDRGSVTALIGAAGLVALPLLVIGAVVLLAPRRLALILYSP